MNPMTEASKLRGGYSEGELIRSITSLEVVGLQHSGGVAWDRPRLFVCTRAPTLDAATHTKDRKEYAGW
jgi:hypothetical protein